MENIAARTVEQWPLQRLIPYARNARTHDESQVSQIAGSIVEFGFVNPILVAEDGTIIAGHGRLMAAQLLKLDTAPVIVLSHLSEAQRRALVIADNKLAEQAGWDEELLALELGDLHDLGFDLDVMGFSEEELDDLLAVDSSDEDADEDIVPDVEATVIAQRGDIWVLGDHRVMCGDATDRDDVDALMDGALADVCWTDPPYGVNYGDNAKDKMRGKDRRILNDNLGEGFYPFLLAAMRNILAVTKGACYVCMSSSEIHTLQKAFTDAGGRWSTFVIWAKNHFTLGRADYQRQYEPILYGWKDGNDHYWCGDRNQGDVWFVDKPTKNDVHPTMKPVVLVERAIKNSSKTRDVVLDLFGGGGSTLIACERSRRSARLMELDPKYVDVIVRRWQEFTGKDGVLLSTQETFDTVSTQKENVN